MEETKTEDLADSEIFKLPICFNLKVKILKDTIIDFLKWLLKRICSNWNTVREKIL